jgi:glycolate oxidase iron-sulfur subunit
MSCTHCGICLESCPTYTLWGAEAESPRGRVVLIEDMLAPGGKVTVEAAAHIESCLGCMACMSVCPEDVAYGDLLATAQDAIRRDLSRPAGERLRRRAALAVIPRAGRFKRLDPRGSIPHFTAAHGSSRGRVGLLLGCSERAAHSPIQKAAVAVLTAEGYDVIAPRLPECCGALELQSGERERGLRRAQATITAFGAVGGVDQIVTSAGACGVALKDYGRLLGTPEARAFSALVLDVHELLAREPRRSDFGTLPLRIAYHDPCQLRHGQGLADEPRSLLRAIEGVELIELPSAASACCGGPGVYGITQAAASEALGRRQAQAIIETGVELVVSADHGCISQLHRHLRERSSTIAICHPLEILARTLKAA